MTLKKNEKKKEKKEFFKGQRVALRAKWSSHSNACGCLRPPFFLWTPRTINHVMLKVIGLPFLGSHLHEVFKIQM